jgi:hypothetical protein
VRSIHTTTKGVHTYEESTGAIQPKEKRAHRFHNWKGNNYNNANRWRRPNIPNLPDPNAMDLSPGRARLAQAEDYEPGKNRYQPPEGVGPRDWHASRTKESPQMLSIVTNQVTLKEIVDSP